MLPNEVPVIIGGGTHYYSLTSLAENRSVRQEIGTNLSLPQSMTVSRNTTGKGNKAIDSYLIRLDSTVATEVDASSNVQASQTLSAYIVIKVPRGIAAGSTAAYNLGMAVRALLSTTSAESSTSYLQRILKGEL